MCEQDKVLVICFGDTGRLWANRRIKILLRSNTFLPHLRFHWAFAHLYQRVDQGLPVPGLETGAVVSFVMFWDDCIGMYFERETIKAKMSPSIWRHSPAFCHVRWIHLALSQGSLVEDVKKMVVLPYGFWEQVSAEILVRSGKIAQYFWDSFIPFFY